MLSKSAKKYLAAAAFCVSSAHAQAGTTADYRQVYGTLYDYMVMDVCTSDAAGNNVIKNQFPSDNKQLCPYRRDLRPNEVSPYSLRMFGSSPDYTSSCPGQKGAMGKLNVPYIRANSTRILTMYDKGTLSSECRNDVGRVGLLGVKDSTDDDAEGSSVYWLNGDYGGGMGGWSPGGYSYWVTPSGCKLSESPSSGLRTMNGWIIANRAWIDSSGTVDDFLNTSYHDVTDEAHPMKDCAFALATDPKTHQYKYQSVGYTVTYKGTFSFGSSTKTSFTLPAIVSDHYSQASSNSTPISYGNSMQFERSYYTKEFGLTRWEKWARHDWVHPSLVKVLDGRETIVYATQNGQKTFTWSFNDLTADHITNAKIQLSISRPVAVSHDVLSSTGDVVSTAAKKEYEAINIADSDFTYNFTTKTVTLKSTAPAIKAGDRIDMQAVLPLTAIEEAGMLRFSGRCSKPFETPAQVKNTFTTWPLQDSAAVYQPDAMNGKTFAKQPGWTKRYKRYDQTVADSWYLLQCSDYTNLLTWDQSPTDPVTKTHIGYDIKPWAEQLDRIFWAH